jgi:hypothetical protein
MSLLTSRYPHALEFLCNVLISNRFRSEITDRALRGPDIGTDNNLLKISFKVKLGVKTENKYNEKRKMVNIFKNPKWKQ